MDFFNILQQQNALNRMNIIPEALLFEAPRPRTDDVKPGMSNIKVREGEKAFFFLEENSHFHSRSDFPHPTTRNDSSCCSDDIRNYVLPTTEGEFQKIVVEN